VKKIRIEMKKRERRRRKKRRDTRTDPVILILWILIVSMRRIKLAEVMIVTMIKRSARRERSIIGIGIMIKNVTPQKRNTLRMMIHPLVMVKTVEEGERREKNISPNIASIERRRNEAGKTMMMMMMLEMEMEAEAMMKSSSSVTFSIMTLTSHLLLLINDVAEALLELHL
jgi:hypothetical protein